MLVKWERMTGSLPVQLTVHSYKMGGHEAAAVGHGWVVWAAGYGGSAGRREGLVIGA